MTVPLFVSERSNPKITRQQLSVDCLIYEQMDQIDLSHWLEAGDKADLALMSESVMSLLASIVPTNATPSSSSKEGSGPGQSARPIASPGSGASRSRRGHQR